MFEQDSEEDDVHNSHCSHDDCDIWKKSTTKINYGSRRKKNFDAGDQEGDDFEGQAKFVQTAAITYRDTQGNTRTHAANK